MSVFSVPLNSRNFSADGRITRQKSMFKSEGGPAMFAEKPSKQFGGPRGAWACGAQAGACGLPTAVTRARARCLTAIRETINTSSSAPASPAADYCGRRAHDAAKFAGDTHLKPRCSNIFAGLASHPADCQGGAMRWIRFVPANVG